MSDLTPEQLAQQRQRIRALEAGLAILQAGYDLPPGGVMDQVRQVIVHPMLWPHLEDWLTERGLGLNLLSPESSDDLATYTISPRNLKETPTNE